MELLSSNACHTTPLISWPKDIPVAKFEFFGN
jgi:hypothetical protein